MSSSRSIAAARNRKAGEQPPTRPNTSIASTSVFSQQPRGVPQRPPPPPQQQHQQKPRISISDAIGLTTIRLCKVENFISELKETGVTGLPPNSQVVDNGVLNNMISRLDALEKKEIAAVEQIKRLERENGELVAKLDAFTKEAGDRFDDFDLAFVEIEKMIPLAQEAEEHDENITLEVNDVSSVDLKATIKEEEEIAANSAA